MMLSLKNSQQSKINSNLCLGWKMIIGNNAHVRIGLKTAIGNTTYFHHHASHRQHRNHISFIMDDARVKHETHQEIAKAACDSFQTLFTADQHGVDFNSIFGDATFLQLKDTDYLWMSRTFTEEEVRVALKSMHPTKAPGRMAIIIFEY